MLPTQQPEPREASTTRRSGNRLFLAIVTLVLTVMAVVGIQALANRITAPHPAVAVEALGTGSAAATQHTGFGAAVLVAVVLLIFGAAKLVSRMRAASPKHTYWDDMPWW